jgi:hypothetical protein
MRFLRAALIYATLALGLATVWALGEQSRAEAELSRAQRLGASRECLAAIRAAPADDPEPDAPATRPALPTRPPIPQAIRQPTP